MLAAMPAEKVIAPHARRGSYLPAACVLIAALGLAGYYGVTRARTLETVVIQFVAPGEHDVDLAVGSYTVFRQGGGAEESRDEAKMSKLEASIALVNNGASVVVRRSSLTSRLSLGRRTGYPLLQFE